MAKALELATVREAVAAHQPGRSYRLANQNRMNHQFTEITERIHAFISGSHADFGTLARDLFALQFENVAPYRRFCESRGIHPNNSKTIPALPTSAFRDYEITSLGPDDRATVFQSRAPLAKHRVATSTTSSHFGFTNTHLPPHSRRTSQHHPGHFHSPHPQPMSQGRHWHT